MVQPLFSIVIPARKPARFSHQTGGAVEARYGSPDTLELIAALAGYRKVPNRFRQHPAAV
jgi:hypothetical protein